MGRKEGHLKRDFTAQAGNENVSGVDTTQDDTAQAGVNKQ